MGPNTTGKPKTEDYLLGRGIVYLALFNAAGQPVSFRDLGNAPDFAITVEGENLDHEASRTGLKFVDKSVTLRQKLGIKFSLDEFNNQNLALYFSGETSAHTNVSVAGFAERLMVADGNLALGVWYPITNAAGNRAYDVTLADLTVETNEAVPVALVHGTDYELDSEMGRIFILSTSVVAATAIAANKGLLVTLAANAGANAVTQVKALTKSSVRGELVFIADNPAADGDKIEFRFPSASLTASGEMGLISDDWSKMEFTGVAERNAAGDSMIARHVANS